LGLCIVNRGHDFRKSYAELGVLRQTFPKIPIIAATATATSKVEQSIRESLNILNACRVHKSFLRDNIHYSVRYTDGELYNTTVGML
jgi:ATP-dependent DNA helicase RecQ